MTHPTGSPVPILSGNKTITVAKTKVFRPRSGVDWACQGHCFKAGLFVLGLFLFTVSGNTAVPDKNSSVPPVPGMGIFPPTVPMARGDDEFLIPEVFQGHLPSTLEKYALRFSVNPRVGDLQNKDHMRLITGLRYGVSENFEIGASSDLYFSHGHGDVHTFENYGAANLKLSAKVNLGEPFFPGWKVGAGFECQSPIGRPPAELTDGLRHFNPYVTFSHRLEAHPDMRIFFGFRFDLLGRTSVQGELGKNSVTENASGVTGGWVIDRKNWHYTFEASYDTTRWLGHTAADIYVVRPGVLWEIPKRNYPQLKSNWLVGLAVKSTFGPGGTSIGASFRLRYSRDFKKLLRRAPVIP